MFIGTGNLAREGAEELVDGFLLKIIGDFLKTDDFLCTPIDTGGSSRRFYRVSSSSETFIVSITDDSQEFEYYTTFASGFRERGVNLPEFYRIFPEHGAVIMEDAGKTSLYSVASAPHNEPYIEKIYMKVLDALIDFQKAPFPLGHAIYARPFNYDSLRWESLYFTRHLFGTFLNRSDLVTEDMDKDFDRIASLIAEQPMVNMHRDFQSQNIYLKDGNIFFIDFQGARQGSLFYDPASLIYDPYLILSSELRHNLFKYYFKKSFENNLHSYDFERGKREFLLTSISRIMQALGAYGNLGINKGKKQFLDFIPSAFRTLNLLLAESDFYALQKACQSLLCILP